MNARLALMVPMLCLLSLTVGPGCGAGKAYDIGRQAEERGDAHLAHEYYVQAGTKRPGNKAIREGLKRTAPAAVAFWREQAAVAESQGRYDDAWRMLMRALRILPSDQQTLTTIRRLETEHGLAVASARADYLQRGEPALKVELARADTRPPSATMPETTELVNVSPEPAPRTRSAAKRPAVEPIAQTFAGNVPPDNDVEKQTTEPPEQKTAAATPEPKEPFALQFAESSKDADERPDRLTPESTDSAREQSPIIRPKASQPVQAAESDEPRRPPRSEPPRAKTESPRTNVHDAPVLTEKEYAEVLAKRQAANEDQRPQQEFHVVRTFSRENDKFPKEALLIDGVSLKLKDTDDELDADLNLYINKKRVQKIRDLPVGRPVAFKGQSGKTYTLTILSIHHNSHTVRLGVNPQ